MKNNELHLRPLNNSDIELLTFWLHKEYILEWYHDADEWLAEINERHGAYSWIHHFIVMKDKTPIGFCQYYDCYDANGMEDWYDITLPGNTFSIDYLIGNENYLGKGYGKAIIRLLSDTIKAGGNANRIIVQPEPENLASCHALIANGYVYDEQLKYYCKALE